MSTSERIRLDDLRQNTRGHTAAGLWRHPHSKAHRMNLRGHP